VRATIPNTLRPGQRFRAQRWRARARARPCSRCVHTALSRCPAAASAVRRAVVRGKAARSDGSSILTAPTVVQMALRDYADGVALPFWTNLQKICERNRQEGRTVDYRPKRYQSNAAGGKRMQSTRAAVGGVGNLMNDMSGGVTGKVMGGAMDVVRDRTLGLHCTLFFAAVPLRPSLRIRCSSSSVSVFRPTHPCAELTRSHSHCFAGQGCTQRRREFGSRRSGRSR
jgi:hypothetical protein